MAFTPEQILNLDLSYPGISFGYESWALDSYLKVLEEQIEHARSQYRLRANHQLARDSENLEHQEYGARLSEIDEAADAEIPRFFRIGAVVAIWGLFESSLTDYALYVGRREKVGLSYKDIRAESFRRQIEKYFENVVRISIPWSPSERESLGRLQELRNFLAHRNGRLMDLPPESEKRIKELVSRMAGVTIEGSAVVVSPSYVAEAADLVIGCVGRFNQQLANKYVQPIPQGR